MATEKKTWKRIWNVREPNPSWTRFRIAPRRDSEGMIR